MATPQGVPAGRPARFPTPGGPSDRAPPAPSRPPAHSAHGAREPCPRCQRQAGGPTCSRKGQRERQPNSARQGADHGEAAGWQQQ
eukprot:7579001-Alexandrium_andersonii.AAC.1